MNKYKRILLLLPVLMMLLSLSSKAHGDGRGELPQNIFNEWNYLLAAVLIVIMGFYLIKFKESFSQSICFFLALVVFYIALGSPLHLLGDQYLFSAHMLEQSIVYIALPPLLLLGLPKKIIEPLMAWGLKKKIFSILKYPLILLLLFNVLFSLYHIPTVFNTVVGNTLLHNMTHAVLTFTAILMWVPLIPLTRELETLSEIQKIGYIFASGVLLTPACALIIFSNDPFYTVYSNAPQLFDLLPPLDDQRTGGIIMKVFQEIVYGSMIGYIFFKWAKKERENEKSYNLDVI
ncbi:cytochrome c oxidase assembly protein [Rossellomorea aquimaris]|uniref:Putative membrane protein n=1 Tax=Rossellomorea aquimaris TaxID=189382 RepID=A0A366ESH8_9BACI|nr:cytochrome c oxidase assembly protein [Rossellomorea aquimaris]RBP05347.1 putative membrane protein [Rossellomorea aquimaris]